MSPNALDEHAATRYVSMSCRTNALGRRRRNADDPTRELGVHFGLDHVEDVRITFTHPGHLPGRFLVGLTSDQANAMRAIASTKEATVSTIVQWVGRPRRTVQRTLETLANAGKIQLVHTGRYARWRIVAH